MTYWSSAEDNFDSYGRLTRSHAVVDPAGTPDDLVDLNYKYDDLGNPTWRYDALQNGSGGAPKWSQHYQYDRRSQLTKAVQGEMDGTWSSAPTMTSPDNTWVWHGEHEGETYSLDAMGNWEKSLNKDGQIDVRAHNTSNQITNRTVNDQQRTVAFDAAGNMTDNGSSYKCVYDFLNRLIEVTRQDDTTLAKYYYDGLNRRIRKIEYATDGTTEESDVRYLYDIDWRVIEERDENDSSALVARYIYGGMYIDDPVVMYRDLTDDGDFADTNEVLYYLQDRLFNVVALTNVSGEVVERFSYQPYGRPTSRRTSDNDETVYSHFGNPYLFTGRRLDSDDSGDSTCFYLLRNRYYSAALGRFINRDPIGYDAGDMNLYRYVGNNPVVHVDPTGLICCGENGKSSCRIISRDPLIYECFNSETGQNELFIPLPPGMPVCRTRSRGPGLGIVFECWNYKTGKYEQPLPTPRKPMQPKPKKPRRPINPNQPGADQTHWPSGYVSCTCMFPTRGTTLWLCSFHCKGSYKDKYSGMGLYTITVTGTEGVTPFHFTTSCKEWDDLKIQSEQIREWERRNPGQEIAKLMCQEPISKRFLVK